MYDTAAPRADGVPTRVAHGPTRAFSGAAAPVRRAAAAAAAAIVLLGTAALARAEPPAVPAAGSFEWQETFAWGIAEHALDSDTEVTGWRLNRHWYLGRQSGEDAVSLTWQGSREQVTISTDGIRFTRRF